MSNYVSCGDGQSNLVTVPAGPDAAGKIPGACNVAAARPESTSSVTSATFPGGSASDTAIPTAASSLGGTVNPVNPPDVTDAPPYSAPTPGSSPGGDPDAAQRNPSGVTVTETITRAVVHTVAGCPETVVNCPYRSRVSTRIETMVTTYCPGHDDSETITEVSAPAKTLVIDIGNANPDSYKYEQQQQQQQQGQEQEGVEQPGEQVTITTAYVPTTTIYKILSCAPGGEDDGDCTPGKTTTRVITVAKTVVVHPIPTAAASGWNHTASGGDGSIKNGSIAPAWNRDNVVVSAAAPLDDAKVDRRYLGAVFVVVWGVMVLL